MAMTPNEQMTFQTQFQEMRTMLGKVTANDKSENTRALWSMVWMLSLINQDLVAIYNELDYTNRAQRVQSDAVNKQIESFQKQMEENRKNAPKNWEEFQKQFREGYEEAQKEAEAQMTPERRKEAADNLRKMADDLESGKYEEDLKKRAAASNLHPIEKNTVEGKSNEDGTTDSYSVHFPKNDNPQE